MKNQMGDMTLPQEKFYGIYRGVVEDNNDPLQAGRCRIRIFGLHSEKKIVGSTDGVATDHLPWAEPAFGLIEGSVSNYGLWSVPLQGSHVFLFFEGGNVMQPRFFATVPGIVSEIPSSDEGFADPDGVYPDKTGVDFDTANGTYPHNIVFRVHGGHYIEIDSTPDNKRLHVYHVTGTYVLIDHSGNITINGVLDRTKTIAQDETINIGNDKSETIGNDKTVNISGNYAITVGGNCTLNVTGNCAITAARIDLN